MSRYDERRRQRRSPNTAPRPVVGSHHRKSRTRTLGARGRGQVLGANGAARPATPATYGSLEDAIRAGVVYVVGGVVLRTGDGRPLGLATSHTGRFTLSPSDETGGSI